MEKMSLQSPRTPSAVPLARDPDGNPLELPDGTVGWRIRRQTGGRPRQQLDSKKQPMVFPLDYTAADADDILPPGSYLLDAIGKAGEMLGLTVALSIGTGRAAGADTDDDVSGTVAIPATLPVMSSDVRLVLEANVRATQMAFLHNQRTLELGLRMAETLRDGVQILASSQAEWIKSMSPRRTPIELKQIILGACGGDDDDAPRPEPASPVAASDEGAAGRGDPWTARRR